MIDHIPADDLSALLDDALTPARRGQVEAHLVSCADCRAELESLRWARSYTRALPPAPMPSGMQLRLPEDATLGKEADDAPLRFPAWRGVAAMAAMLALAFMLGRLGGGDESGSGTAGMDAASSVANSLDYEESADEAADLREDDSFDIDDAADMAFSRSEPEDDTDAMLQPLATAITSERTLTGERGRASLDLATAPESAGTATAAAADTGGYRPPDAQVPGAPAARDGSAPVAGTASALTAVRATAESALALLTRAAAPPESGGGPSAEALETASAIQPEATIQAVGTALVELASAPGLRAAARADEPAGAAAATAVASETSPPEAALAAAEPSRSADQAAPPESETVAESPADGEDTIAVVDTDASEQAGADARSKREDAVENAADEAPAGEGVAIAPDEPGAADASALPGAELRAPRSPEAPPAASGASRSLILPLAAIAIGLLALGTLFLRQGLRRRRRRRHLDL